MPRNARSRPPGRLKPVRMGTEADRRIRALRKRLRHDPADRLIRMLEEAGLGPFVPEYPFAQQALGRGWRFDVAWPRLRVAVEIEGGIFGKNGQARPCILCKQIPKGAHGSVSGILRDIEKYNAGVMLGWRIYRVPTNAITHETVRTIGELLHSVRRSTSYGRVGSRPRTGGIRHE